LKVISLHSVGYDNVDIAAATAMKMPIGNTPGVLSDATADTAFTHAGCFTQGFYMHKTIQEAWGFFEPTANLGIDIRGKTRNIRSVQGSSSLNDRGCLRHESHYNNRGQ
jgi:lactate dehydrogenase-like 2-hydroxyacid dehydrogenase